MRQQRNDRSRTVGGADSRSSEPTRATVRSEDLHIRNYDHQWAYDLEVVIVAPDGDPVFRKQYYLQPGRTESEHDLLSGGGGGYEVRAILDNARRESRECRIGSSPDHTAVIEIGNGALSLTEGLHS